MDRRIRAAMAEVERRRKGARISLRDAAARVGMSEANWRQLTAGKVRANGDEIERVARIDQALDMGMAVGALDEIAEILGVDDAEVEAARQRVVIEDPAVMEIMSIRHLSAREKLVLIEALELERSRQAP